MIDWARMRSPWTLHFNSGSCNGCDIGIEAAFTSRYDIERLGILREGSPRNADLLAVTGGVTLQAKKRLIRIYDQMPNPKYVAAIGSCAPSSSPFTDSYNIYGGTNKVLQVDVCIVGCPTKPEAIIKGLLKITDKEGKMGKDRLGRRKTN